MMRTLIRSTASVTALPAAALVIAGHLLLRGHAWQAEWLWTFDSYNFVVMLLLPVAAGAACWDGAAWSAFRPQTDAAGRALPTLVRLWCAHAVVVGTAFGIGLLVACAAAAVGTAPGLPTGRTLATVLPTLALLGFGIAAGLVTGWTSQRTLLAPLVAIGAFGALIFGYSSMPGLFVRVAGATASLLGLQPRPEVQAAQVGFYAAATAALLGGAALRSPGAPRARVATAIGTTAAVVLACVILAAGEAPFEPARVTVSCDRQEVDVCLAPGYLQARPAFHQALDRPVTALRATGIADIDRFTQDPHDHGKGVATLPPTMGADASTVASVLMTLLVPHDCDIYRDRATSRDLEGITAWLFALAGAPMYGPHDPAPVWGHDGPAARRWVRGAVHRLERCES